VRSSIVWEVSETALVKAAGGLYTPPPVAVGSSGSPPPGLRLAALWDAYDRMDDTARRAAFRRLAEVDPSTASHDVRLPKGSTDIHLFTVTTQTLTGIEPPWPGSGTADAHLHLQAAIAPRLRRPAPPLARATPNDDGTVTLALFSASRIPVDRFLVFATRSEAAARDRESMGPPVASVSATMGGTDPVTSSPVYEGSWTGSLGAVAWDPWLVRVVARPVDTLPVDGVRGQTSDASDVVSVLVPPAGAPDLDAPSVEVWGADHRGVVVRTSTSAPTRATASGSHRFGATTGPGATDVVVPAPLESLAETTLTTPPTAASTSPAPERGARVAGRSPLAVWFTRPVATDPVDVTLRLVDPFGRTTERTITVPGWVPPPPFTVTITGLVPRPTGVLALLETDAPTAASAGIVLHVRALKRRFGPIVGPVFDPLVGPLPRPDRPLPPVGPVSPVGPLRPPVVPGAPGPLTPAGPLGRPPVGRPPVGPLFPLVTVVTGDVALADIPVGLPFFPADGQVHAVRVKGPGGAGRYAVWVPVVAPLTVEVVLESPDGRTARATSSTSST
jgi:hypothetical protein